MLKKLITVLILLCVAIPASAAVTHRSIIELGKKAKADGEIAVVFLADNAEPVDISIAVGKGQKVKFIAETLMVAIRNEVDGQRYKINLKDDRKINIEGIGDAQLEVTVTKQTVPGLSVVVNNR